MGGFITLSAAVSLMTAVMDLINDSLLVPKLCLSLYIHCP